MNCNEIKDMISLYIDRELEDEEKLLFEKHIEQCENCKKEFEEYKKIINMLQNLTEEEPPKGYCKRLHEKLLNVKLQSKANTRSRWIKYSSIAAAFVLIFSTIYISSITGGFKDGASKKEKSIAYDDQAPATELKESPAAAPPADINGGGFTGIQSEGVANKRTMDNAEVATNYGITVAPIENAEMEMKIIKSGYIVTQTEAYDVFINDLILKVESFGGYLEQNNTSVRTVYDDRDLKYGNLIVRIPQDKFNEFIDFLETTSEVNQKNINETDVTKDYYEKDNQVKNLELQESHLRELFAKAQTVEEMLLIENELRRIRTEIDALNISLSDIDDRASMSTITLEVEEVLKTNLTLPYRDSIWGRARDGFINTVNGLVEFVENIIIWLVSISPVLIPILIVILILVLIKKRKIKKEK